MQSVDDAYCMPECAMTATTARRKGTATYTIECGVVALIPRLPGPTLHVPAACKGRGRKRPMK